MKRLYIVRHCDDDYENNYAIVANDVSEAKKFGMSCLDCEYIDVRARVIKKIDVSKEPLGEFEDYLRILKEGGFSYVFNIDCPTCGAQETTVYYDNGFYCSDCEDKR